MLHETAVLVADVVREAGYPLVGEVDDYEPLMKLISDAPLVLIGEASRGTTSTAVAGQRRLRRAQQKTRCPGTINLQASITSCLSFAQKGVLSVRVADE